MTLIRTLTGDIDSSLVSGVLPRRDFRSAWQLDPATSVISIDVNAAKQLVIDRIIKARAEQRSLLHEEIIEALLSNNVAEQARLSAKLVKVKAIENDAGISSARDVTDLTDWWDSNTDELGPNPYPPSARS